MTALDPNYEITGKDVAKDKGLRAAGVALPFLLSLVPFFILFFFGLISSVTTTSAMFFFFSLVTLVGGFLFGLGGSALVLFYRSRWLTDLRERLAVDGIRADEVMWFKKELKSSERRTLKEVRQKDLLLADAYQETLASRLTATRIIRSSGRELLLAKRRENKLRYLKSEHLEAFRDEVRKDIENISRIRKDAREMEIEAESRLQMIEAAARRGTELAGNELALKRLSARTEQLPLALEEARMEEELRKEFADQLEKDFENELKQLDLADTE